MFWFCKLFDWIITKISHFYFDAHSESGLLSHSFNFNTHSHNVHDIWLKSWTGKKAHRAPQICFARARPAASAPLPTQSLAHAHSFIHPLAVLCSVEGACALGVEWKRCSECGAATAQLATFSTPMHTHTHSRLCRPRPPQIRPIKRHTQFWSSILRLAH